MFEIRTMQRLRHENIVAYRGTYTDSENLSIFMDYVPGGSICSMLEKFGHFNERLIMVYTQQILQGLDYLHCHRIIHRDIKGANILVDTDGRCKLADFGASKRLADIASQTGGGNKSLRGTPFWMAPEVIKQIGHGRQADIWSVGCTIIEMGTGKPPWVNFTSQISAMLHIANTNEPPLFPEFLSDSARDFLLLMFERDPLLRPHARTLLEHPFLRVDDLKKSWSTTTTKWPSNRIDSRTLSSGPNSLKNCASTGMLSERTDKESSAEGVGDTIRRSAEFEVAQNMKNSQDKASTVSMSTQKSSIAKAMFGGTTATSDTGKSSSKVEKKPIRSKSKAKKVQVGGIEKNLSKQCGVESGNDISDEHKQRDSKEDERDRENAKTLEVPRHYGANYDLGGENHHLDDVSLESDAKDRDALKAERLEGKGGDAQEPKEPAKKTKRAIGSTFGLSGLRHKMVADVTSEANIRQNLTGGEQRGDGGVVGEADKIGATLVLSKELTKTAKEVVAKEKPPGKSSSREGSFHFARKSPSREDIHTHGTGGHEKVVDSIGKENTGFLARPLVKAVFPFQKFGGFSTQGGGGNGVPAPKAAAPETVASAEPHQPDTIYVENDENELSLDFQNLDWAQEEDGGDFQVHHEPSFHLLYPNPHPTRNNLPP
jgi:serine/threonine protein kinase